MIKLQDFARECGVTDRAIQKHLKTYAAELEGLFQRKGPNGTWLTDEACEILRSKMKQQPIAVLGSDPRIEQLERELAEVKLIATDIWEQSKQKDKTIASLVEQNQQLQLKANSAIQLEADNELARARTAEAERVAQAAREGLATAQSELASAHEAFELELGTKDSAVRKMREYASALEAYYALPWWVRRKAVKPVPPDFE